MCSNRIMIWISIGNNILAFDDSAAVPRDSRKTSTRDAAPNPQVHCTEMSLYLFFSFLSQNYFRDCEACTHDLNAAGRIINYSYTLDSVGVWFKLLKAVAHIVLRKTEFCFQNWYWNKWSSLWRKDWSAHTQSHNANILTIIHRFSERFTYLPLTPVAHSTNMD